MHTPNRPITLNPTPHTAAPIDIVRRRVDIAFDNSNERAWLALNHSVEDMLNGLSYVFPPGEKFFITSVQHYQDRITDPALQDAVARFIYQEAMHTKQHQKCNHALAHAHPYGPQITRVAEKAFSFLRRFTPHATQLALTSAIEHFFALFADFLLSNQKAMIKLSEPSFAALWLWHCVEETEHKAVCFDVYQNVFGKGVFSYLHRTFAMLAATLFSLSTIAVIHWLIRKNAITKQPATRLVLPGPGPEPPRAKMPHVWSFMRQMLRLKPYFAYYKPSFHPWEHDNSHLIEEWKRAFPDLNKDADKPSPNLSGARPSS